MALSIEQRGHHVTCALIGTSGKLAAYNYASSEQRLSTSLALWTTLEYELVHTNGDIQKVRVEPATRSAVATCKCVKLFTHFLEVIHIHFLYSSCNTPIHLMFLWFNFKYLSFCFHLQFRHNSNEICIKFVNFSNSNNIKLLAFLCRIPTQLPYVNLFTHFLEVIHIHFLIFFYFLFFFTE